MPTIEETRAEAWRVYEEAKNKFDFIKKNYQNQKQGNYSDEEAGANLELVQGKFFEAFNLVSSINRDADDYRLQSWCLAGLAEIAVTDLKINFGYSIEKYQNAIQIYRDKITPVNYTSNDKRILAGYFSQYLILCEYKLSNAPMHDYEEAVSLLKSLKDRTPGENEKLGCLNAKIAGMHISCENYLEAFRHYYDAMSAFLDAGQSRYIKDIYRDISPHLPEIRKIAQAVAELEEIRRQMLNSSMLPPAGLETEKYMDTVTARLDAMVSEAQGERPVSPLRSLSVLRPAPEHAPADAPVLEGRPSI